MFRLVINYNTVIWNKEMHGMWYESNYLIDKFERKDFCNKRTAANYVLWPDPYDGNYNFLCNVKLRRV